LRVVTGILFSQFEGHFEMSRLLALAGALLILPLAGCGGADIPELGEVEGTVTIDGKPASGILVSFVPTAGGRPSSGITNDDGYYELQYSPQAMGALVGSHHVSIVSEEPSTVDDPGERSAPLVQKSKIPQQYLATKKQIDVKAGSNTADLTYP
jgi:hypothetical protein